MQPRAHFSASLTSRLRSDAASTSSRGSTSRGTSMRTWCSEVSVCPPRSCRCSETSVTCSTSASTTRPRSSSSAGVASRPEKTPKLILISMCGRSRPFEANAIGAGSRGPWDLSSPFRRFYALPRLPAEARGPRNRPERAPGGEHGHSRALVPDLTIAEDDVARQRMKYVSGSTSAITSRKRRIRVSRPERAGDERHRQVDRVDDRRRALGGADDSRQPRARGREGQRRRAGREDEREDSARERHVEEQPASTSER